MQEYRQNNFVDMERNFISKCFMNETFTTRKEMYSYCVKIIKNISSLHSGVRYYTGITRNDMLYNILHKSQLYNFAETCICIIIETVNTQQSHLLESELEYRFRKDKYNITSVIKQGEDLLIKNNSKFVYVVFELSKEFIESKKDYINDKIKEYNKSLIEKKNIRLNNIKKRNDEMIRMRKQLINERNMRILIEQAQKRKLFMLNMEKQREKRLEKERIESIKTMLKPCIKTIQINYIKDTNTTCQCCLCDYNKDELIYCDKLSEEYIHIICHDCMRRNIDVMISNGVCNFDCIYNSSDCCGGIYNKKEIENILSCNKEKYDKFMEIYEITTISNMALVVDDFQICPHCRRFGLEINNMIPISKIKCERCFKYWCNKCGRDAHDIENGSNCYTISLSNFNREKNIENSYEQLNIIIDNMITSIISKSVIDTCSHCNSAYMKTEGCNLITCSKCGNLTCHCCGEKITEILVEGGRMTSKYHHFIGNDYNDGSGNCPLFYNEENYNANQENKIHKIRKITDEFILLMNSNKELMRDIYSRIEKLVKSNTLDYDINIEIFQDMIRN